MPPKPAGKRRKTTPKPDALALADEQGLSWVDLVKEYNPTRAIEIIQGGAVDEFLSHRQKASVPFNDDRKLRFLRHVAATGRIVEAALVAGVAKGTPADHARQDPDGFGQAKEDAIDFFRETVIDRAAHKFAIEGWDEPVFFRGEQVGSVHKFCPRTFENYAKRQHPAYRERVQQDVNITGGILVIPASAANTADWLNEAKAVEAKAVEAEHEVIDD